ncbi:MAG: hypothetical protein CENE_03198 [Candidatus Celerinatantimonas neptuna]|nr:MAG: hypothetical protein CENE_03198 [Candidatus Celerinatantimonas neptuna]
MRIFRTLLLCLLPVLATGCASLTGRDLIEPYSQQMAPMRQDLAKGQLQAAIDSIKPGSPRDTSYYLKQLELGRLQFLSGHFKSSQQHFKRVADHIQWLESQAKYRLSNGLQNSVSVVTNDSARSYRIPVYEQVMLHHYEALNYLHQHNLTGAMVEIRKAELLQQNIAYRQSWHLGQLESQYQGQVKSVLDQYPSMQALISQSKNQYQNAYTYLLSAALYQAVGQPNDAYIDYKKALSISPDNQQIGAITAELADRLDMPAKERLNRRFKALEQKPGQGLLIILYEQNLIPYRRQIALRLPVSINHHFQFLSVAFPVLTQDPKPSPPLILQIGEHRLESTIAAQLQSLAAWHLKEQLPMMILRQLIRLSGKTVFADQLSRQNPLLGLLATAYNTITEHADTRSWESLPASAQFAIGSFKAGSYKVRLSGARDGLLPLKIRENKVTLVVIGDLGHSFTSQVFLL